MSWGCNLSRGCRARVMSRGLQYGNPIRRLFRAIDFSAGDCNPIITRLNLKGAEWGWYNAQGGRSPISSLKITFVSKLFHRTMCKSSHLLVFSVSLNYRQNCIYSMIQKYFNKLWDCRKASKTSSFQDLSQNDYMEQRAGQQMREYQN